MMMTSFMVMGSVLWMEGGGLGLARNIVRRYALETGSEQRSSSVKTDDLTGSSLLQQNRIAYGAKYLASLLGKLFRGGTSDARRHAGNNDNFRFRHGNSF
jgi:hypothetical protein